ncbi:MAG: acetoin utilization protein AcuC [Actinobacteria bacterium]|nr:acetoin utilization protein AcuC [Actinomycetota bacterium]
MSDSVAMVWSEDFLSYQLAEDHPLHPVRLALTVELAETFGLFDDPRLTMVTPVPAGDDLLRLVHTAGYLDAVRAAPVGATDPRHGLGPPDNPVFAGMHEAAALIVGGSVRAAELVWSGRAQHAVNIAGGLHHAMPDRAAGFCVYNDPAVAIAWLLAHGAERVAYVDVDVHHGDGVQHAFYADPRVLTVSLHQDPLTLFPGTGLPQETGSGAAEGTAVNVALPPGTGDAGWLRAFHAVVPSVLRAFHPQVLVTQCGCDSHRDDPIADLALTVDGQRAGYAALHRLAHELCEGRWVVLGGGGYGLVRCVPRAWTHLIAEVSGTPIEPATAIPAAWVDRVRARGYPVPAPTRMTDGGTAEYQPWQPGESSAVDTAIAATRRAIFPLHGLDPDDPRD